MKRLLLIISFLFSLSCFGQSATINITEVNYNSDSTMNSGNWFEIYNYGASTVDLSLFRLRDASLSNLYLIQPGVTIAPGAYLVFCSDTVNFDNVFNVTNRIGNLGFALGNTTDSIRIYDNLNMPVVRMGYTDSLPWPMGADGFGRTLEIINNSLPANDPASWRTGCMYGSPGAAMIPCVNETIVVSEINYKSAPTEDAGDWFEIRNIGNTSVNIGNYGVRNHLLHLHYTIPSGTILGPQQSIVLYNTPALFNTQFPLLLNKVGPFLFGLDGDGDAIRLYNASDKIIFSVYYNDDPPWVNTPDGFGYTLEADTLFNFSRDVGDATSWFAGCPEGSPGKKYTPDCLGGINDEEINAMNIYPNPAIEFVRIDLNEKTDDWKLKVYNTVGQLVLASNNQPIVQVSNLSNGTYIFELSASTFLIRKKIIIQHE